MGKNLLAMRETRVPSLRRENPLEKGMATHSSILARRIPWTEEPGGLPFGGSQSDRAEQLALAVSAKAFLENLERPGLSQVTASLPPQAFK